MKVLVLALAGLLMATACEGHHQARPDPSAAPARVLDVRGVDWANSAVPGAVCGGSGSVQLHDSNGLVSSARWPDEWNSDRPAQMPSQVEVNYDGPVQYGTIMDDGRPEAVVPIWCTNGGGTADGQLGQGLVVFHGTTTGLAVTAILTTTQPGTDGATYFDNSLTRIERGRVTVEEVWYGPNDATCCPSGRAEAVWTLNGSTLVLNSSHVTAQPGS